MSEEWMNRVEKKIDGLGRRMDLPEVRVDAVATRLEKRIDDFEGRLGQKIDGLGVRLRQRIDGVEGRLAKLEDGQQKLGVQLSENTSNIRALAEGVARLSERMDRGFADVLAKLDNPATPRQATSRYFATKLGDREPRPPKRPRRRRH